MDRVWIVINDNTCEVVYSSFSYSNARTAFDHLKRRFTVAGSALFDFRLCRFDLNGAYAK